MVYMAGDNGKVFETALGRLKLMAEMTTAGYHDLEEMSVVGTTANVAVVCLFDSLDGSFLIEVQRGSGFRDSIVEQLADTNTGDPAVLRDFIILASSRYPSEHSALVIWNHGTGWLDVDHYAVVRDARDAGQSHSPLFRTTPHRATDGETTRPIAYDDSSMDFLDTQDLRRALSEAQQETGRRLSLIGMDACLMAMIEGARELAPFADYFVASQEVEPMAGWPYDTILSTINGEPELGPPEVAQMIVDQFAASYGGVTRVEQTVTQSAIDLARTATTAALVKNLTDEILASPSPELKSVILKAVRDALVFQDRNYRDLGDFARLVAEGTHFTHHTAVQRAASRLHEHLEERGPEGAVLSIGYLPRYERATGLSVYLPATLNVSPPERAFTVYRDLIFPQTTGWDSMLEWLYGEW
jgi:hypothetical protein